MKAKTKATISIIFLIGAIAISALFCVYQYKAEAETGCDDLSGKDKDICEEYNRQAAGYRNLVEIKEKQAELLNNQLATTDSNIQQVQTQISSSSKQIEDLNSQIGRLQKQIKEKEEMIDSQKKLLGQIVQTYYETNQISPITIYLSDGNLTTYMMAKDKLAQTGDKIRELVDSVVKTKKILEDQYGQLDQKKGDLVVKNQDLQDQNDDLSDIKQQRQALLAQTKGEEARYRQLLANIEQQKRELFDMGAVDFSSISLEGMSASEYIKEHEPPSSLFASTDWYYSQRDSKWKDYKIGVSGLTVGSYGCAIASVAMVFTQHGDDITPGKLVKKPIYTQQGLIAWPSKSFGNEVTLTSSKSHGNINWKTIDSELKDDNPVIVYIARSKGGGHYVVVHHKDSKTGKYVVHDPYFGANMYLDTSRALVGVMGSKSSTSVNQMIIYN